MSFWVRSHRAVSLIVLVALLGASGCADRVAGQVELLGINQTTGNIVRLTKVPSLAAEPRAAIPGWGDPIRSNDDVVTIQVESAYVQQLPFRLTGSKDVIIFADVWENGAMGLGSEASLTSIVYVGANEKVPGKLNFRDMLAYGPTKFKGHPLRIQFTMMVLQKSASDKQASAVDIISAIAEAAAPQYSPITSSVAKTLKGILKAQPDIKFFDFNVTFVSDRPEGLAEPIVQTQGREAPDEAPRPAGGFLPGPADTGESIHWLRYGRYALIETEAHDGRTSAVRALKPADIYLEDGWLRRGMLGASLPTSYLIFRVTPGQIDESDDVLKAASENNAKVIAKLHRSDAEVAEGLAAITESAADMKNQVLRARAERLAREIVANAQANKAAPEKALNSQFKMRWDDVVGRLTGTDKDNATQIGDQVLTRWLNKFRTDSGTPPS